jgi:polysaccharide chain length determinant protein (PEP-CTERM system associated)
MDDTFVSSTRLVEFLEIPLRRRKLVLIPALLVLSGAFVASEVLPKTYKSSTLILVELERAPDSFVTKSNAGEQSSKRLNTIRQEVLSRTRLEQVIRELDPYPGRHQPSSETLDEMRADIFIDVKGNDAFNIAYVHSDPRKAQAVAQRLATLFIEEVVQSREQQVESASEFLDVQLVDARKELEAKEAGLRALKEHRMGTLPEQTPANLATLQRLQLEQQALDANLRLAKDRQQSLEKGLAERPRATTGAPVDGEVSIDLAQSQAQLAALRTRYTDEHPEVKAAAARIARLEKQLADQPQPGLVAIDPGAATARTHIEQARMEVRQLEAKQADLRRQVATYQARVEEAPRTEQEIAALDRDYEKLRENYQLLLKKKLETQMVERLEKRWKGESFRILDPAHLPDSVHFPNRTLFLLGGLFGGLVLGLALAILAEFLDHSVKSVREVENALPFPVLVSIPDLDQILSAASKPGRQKRRRAAGGGR